MIGRLDEFPSYWPLESITIRNHADAISRIFRWAGPAVHPRRPAAKLLTHLPYIPPVTAEFETKPPFPLETARAIAAACGRMKRPDLPRGWSRELWWKVRLAIFYYTGLRAGTVCCLQRKHVIARESGLWLQVPGSLIKTGKEVLMPLHGQAAELIASLPPGEADELLVPEACGYRWFIELHSELQALAGIAPAERQSPHAWRRTHLEQMRRLGLDRSLEISRIAADHADGRTTARNYLGQAIVNELRLRLPPLFV